MLAIAVCMTALAQDGFKIIKKIPISGQGSWDYLTVDADARRLYVSHGTQVEVLDVDSAAIVGKIPNTSGSTELPLLRNYIEALLATARPLQ